MHVSYYLVMYRLLLAKARSRSDRPCIAFPALFGGEQPGLGWYQPNRVHDSLNLLRKTAWVRFGLHRDAASSMTVTSP